MELRRITQTCEDCGCRVLVVEDDPSDSSWVTCRDCGWIFGRFKQVKFEAAEQGVPAILAAVKSKLGK